MRQPGTQVTGLAAIGSRVAERRDVYLNRPPTPIPNRAAYRNRVQGSDSLRPPCECDGECDSGRLVWIRTSMFGFS